MISFLKQLSVGLLFFGGSAVISLLNDGKVESVEYHNILLFMIAGWIIGSEGRSNE